MTKFCPGCGNNYSNEYEFCPKCGIKLEILDIIKGLDYKTTEMKKKEFEEFKKLHTHNCKYCNKELSADDISSMALLDFNKNWYCKECGDKHNIGIKCPYCSKRFHPWTRRPTSTSGNIVRGGLFLPWGVTSALKNKPFVKCPHCGMKIMQG